MSCVRMCLLVSVLAACKFTAPPNDNPKDAALIDGAPDPDGGGSEGTAGAWLDPWTRRKSITLLASQIEAPGNAALADFPVLVSIDDQAIGSTALANGSDIVFTAGDATTKLASEIESYKNGKLVAWVRVPVLSATVDTPINVYYGNPAPPAGTPQEVWTASYSGVWHMQQVPSGANDIADSTAGNHDGTAIAMTTGDSVLARIGQGLHFDGANGFVNFNSMDVGNSFTITMWANLQGGSGIKTLLSNSLSGPGKNGFRFFVDSDSTSDRKVLFETGDGTNNSIALTTGNAVTAGTWAHIAVVVDRAAASATIFVNGVDKTASTSTQNDFLTNSDFEVGRMEDIFRWVGMIDEVEIASTKRPIEWFETSFNNQNTPGSFFMIAGEEQAP